jgi:hypothetical protein
MLRSKGRERRFSFFLEGVMDSMYYLIEEER